MNHTVAFIVPCRDKAPWVAETVRSVLAQTYSPMLIVFSDQGSTDGSFEVMEAEAALYEGPNEVRVVRCPDTEYRGMAGYNAHLDWLHNNIEADLFIQSSADDLAHPERAANVVAAWRETGCDYIATRQTYLKADRTPSPNRSYSEIPSAHIPLSIVVHHRFGGKCSSAWTWKIMDKYGPLTGVLCQDLIVPFWAALEGGVYFIGEGLQTYIERPDQNNLGLEGLLRAASTPDEQIIIMEQIQYQMAVTEIFIGKILEERIKGGDDRPELVECLEDVTKSLIATVCGWAKERNYLTMHRLDPGAFPV